MWFACGLQSCDTTVSPSRPIFLREVVRNNDGGEQRGEGHLLCVSVRVSVRERAEKTLRSPSSFSVADRSTSCQSDFTRSCRDEVLVTLPNPPFKMKHKSVACISELLRGLIYVHFSTINPVFYVKLSLLGLPPKKQFSKRLINNRMAAL